MFAESYFPGAYWSGSYFPESTGSLVTFMDGVTRIWVLDARDFSCEFERTFTWTLEHRQFTWSFDQWPPL